MKKAGSLIIFMAMVFLSGCWDVREINELALVMAVGIDKSVQNPGHYLVTVQAANPQPNSSGETSKGPQTVWVASAEAPTIFAAIREIARFSSQRIMWAHNNVIIVGESLAQDDITPVIDFFSHNHELRMKTWMAVAHGDARHFLHANVGMGNIPGQSLGDVFRYQQLTGLGMKSDLLTVYGDFTSPSTNPLIATLTLNQAVTQSGLSKEAESTTDQIQMSGMAVFDDNSLLGFLTEEETRGLSWFMAEDPNTVISVPHPENSEKSVAVEISGVKAKIESQIDDDGPQFTIVITGTGHIAEEQTTSRLSIHQLKSQLEGTVNQEIGREIAMALDKIQKQYGSDVLGFGKVVHTQHKQAWNQTIKSRWTDLFPEAEVKVEVNIDIKTSTLNQIPLKDYKEN